MMFCNFATYKLYYCCRRGNERKMRKYKKIVTLIGFWLVVCIINNFLDFALVNAGVTRIAVHELDKEDYDCVFFGQSHSSYAIDPLTIEESTGLKTMNFSIGGQYMMDMYYYVQHMYENSTPEVVVLDLDYQYFINIPKDDNTIMSTLMYYNYPNTWRKSVYTYDKLRHKEYRAALFPWMNNRHNLKHMEQVIENKMTEDYKNYNPDSIQQIEDDDTYNGRGFIYRSRSYENHHSKVGIWWNEDAVDYHDSVEYFKKIVRYCNKKGSKVVVITTPINKSTLIESKDEYHKIEHYFDNLVEETGLSYYNFNLVKQEKFSRSDKDYWDYDGHMYGDSAQRYSNMLGEFLEKVMSEEVINEDEYFYEDIYDMAENVDLSE